MGLRTDLCRIVGLTPLNDGKNAECENRVDDVECCPRIVLFSELGDGLELGQDGGEVLGRYLVALTVAVSRGEVDSSFLRLSLTLSQFFLPASAEASLETST